MSYIEDLQGECLANLKPQLDEAKEKNPDELLFQMDLSLVSFSYGFINGCKMIHQLNRLITVIKKRKRLMTKKINEKCSDLDLGTEQWNTLPDKQKKEFKKGIKKILLELTEEDGERIKKLKRIRNDIMLRVSNVFLYILTTLLSVGFGVLLYLNNIIINAIVYPILIFSLLGFVTIQILYTVKFLKAIKSTIHGVIIFSIKRMFSTLLVVWSYLFVVAIVNLWETKIFTYSFSAVFMLYVIFMIYDLFLSSNLFDEVENFLSLTVAIIVGLFYFAESVDNSIIKQIGAGILFSACLLLHVLIAKKFILDKKPIKDILGVINVVLIVVTTIVLTVVALYKILWIIPTEGQVADNTLFSAVIGIYAAILGGGLTLAGVAWTIKHGEQLRQDEERKKLQPLFNLVNRNLYQKIDGTKLTHIHGSEFISSGNELKESETECYIESFDMENTSKTEFFICGIYINNVLYKTNTKELIKKDHTIRFDFDQVCFNIDTINEIKLSVEDLIENQYTMELEFSISNHIVTITGNKSLQFVEKTNE